MMIMLLLFSFTSKLRIPLGREMERAHSISQA